MKKDRNLQLFAIVTPGLEAVCADELASLGFAGVHPRHGGVEFRGQLRDIYRANLWLRTASRVMVRVASFRCRSFPELFQHSQRQPWGQFLRPQEPFTVNASSHGSRLFHTDRIGDCVREAVCRALGCPVQPASRQGLRLLVRFEDDRCQLSVDSSGALLHRRGYRQEAAPAPLRETLAAAALMLAGWEGQETLVDPLCGSGTFPIEAALLASGQPPGAGRGFAFMDWPGYRPGLWQALLVEAAKERRFPDVVIAGSDRDPEMLAVARRNAGRAGVEGLLRLDCSPLETLSLPPGPGLLVANPPYGVRLGREQDLHRLYAALGGLCLRGGAGWGCLFIAPSEQLARATGLACRQLGRFSNGGIEVGLYLAAAG